jgi:hypothetical protein
MNCSALCVIPPVRLVGAKYVGWIMTIYLGLCYWAAYSYVFPNAELFFTKWVFTKPLEFVEKCFGIHQFHERFMHSRPIFPSLPLAHLLHAAWWAFSFISTMITKFWGMQNPDKFHGKDENSWGFGQLLALCLISLPLLSGVEIFCGKRKYLEKVD